MAQQRLFLHGGAALWLNALTKVFPTASGEVVAVNDVSLEVAAGKSIAIMGPSGCGKTTLLNLISGIDRPTSGQVLCDGQVVSQLPEGELESYRLSKVGFVFQTFNLIPSLTALGNLEVPMMIAGIPRGTRGDRGLKLLDLFGLKDKAHKRPEELSSGEQQRVAMALALVNDPPLILADEPTGNLDRKNADVVAELLCSLAADYGKTVLLVTHDPRVASRAELCYEMDDGHILERVS